MRQDEKQLKNLMKSRKMSSRFLYLVKIIILYPLMYVMAMAVASLILIPLLGVSIKEAFFTFVGMSIFLVAFYYISSFSVIFDMIKRWRNKVD